MNSYNNPTMAELCSSKISFLLLLCFLSMITRSWSSDEERKAYIVHLGTNESPSSSHSRVLQEVVHSSFVEQSLMTSYKRSFNGFAAYLTDQEREKLAYHEEVVSIFPSRTLYPQTTRSWDFMGLSEYVHRNPSVESDIIIGVIDSGVWPESESFNDEGFGPPPKKWKGACNGGKNFTCNNKLIGARYYNSNPSFNITSARDIIGHGTHTASTAAGSPVKDASFYGVAKGTARGAVPSARIAVYTVCGSQGCDSVDILSAFDDAIADGVDIITISIDGQTPLSLKEDVIAQGALHASQRGILVVQSAGNSADIKTVASVVPWILSAAASSTDRKIITRVSLGDGTILSGKGVNSIRMMGTDFPLVYGHNVSSKCSISAAMDCFLGCLDENLVKGKIVMCRLVEGIDEAFEARAAGSVVALDSYMLQNPNTDFSSIPPLPASALEEQEFYVVQRYFNSTKNPRVKILASETVRNLDSPLVAGFSSRGPNIIIPDLLKPDITAPGMEILAAYSPLASPSNNNGDHRSVKYSVLSGTSMSCPHVAGAAAYVKSFHPDWSPSAIKSALMTTAWEMDHKRDPLAEFSYGAGHINPVRAVDPGMVYETLFEDYIKMLCMSGNDTAALAKIFQGNITCPTGAPLEFLHKDLNYPSMTSRVKTDPSSDIVAFSQIFKRTVTNVGAGNSTYKVTVSKSREYEIKVRPHMLTFGALGERKSFAVVIRGKTNRKMISASLEWSDGVHRVRSPIVVYRDRF